MSSSTSLYDYRDKRHHAMRLRDCGDYDLNSFQMNSEIYRRFARLVKDSGGSLVWEPFGPQDGRSFQFFEEVGIELISFSLGSDHPKTKIIDSTQSGPDDVVDGVIFHPPYLGSIAQSADPRDLSWQKDQEEWISAVECCADIALESINKTGYICTVSRRYRYRGDLFPMDEWFYFMFSKTLSFGVVELHEVWKSDPDIVMIFKVEECE